MKIPRCDSGEFFFFFLKFCICHVFAPPCVSQHLLAKVRPSDASAKSVECFHAALIDIEAQAYAKGFYEGVGFRQSSDTFMLDGIPHIKMTWTR